MKAIIKKLLAKVLGALSQKQNKDWVLIGRSYGGATITYSDLSAQGYTEVYLRAGDYAGASAPISVLPKYLVIGGFHSGGYGLLYGADVRTTRMIPTWAMTDSNNRMANTEFFLYAR